MLVKIKYKRNNIQVDQHKRGGLKPSLKYIETLGFFSILKVILEQGK